MSNKVYYLIISRNDRLEFHVSSNKAEVEALDALSRSAPLRGEDSKYTGGALRAWLQEINAYELIPVTKISIKERISTINL